MRSTNKRQRTLATMNGFERYTKKTRREVFLEEMEQVVPWRELCALIEPHYPKPGNGRPPVGVERMLRLYFLQQWFNLSDPAVEEALYDSPVMRQFVGIDLGQEPGPDETTVCKFRHCWKNMDLGKRFWARLTCTCKPAECASPPARSWTQPSCTHPRRPRTASSGAIRRCTRPKKAISGASG